ncbi:hypothetical protein [Paraliomyxa miuraensis]|uniref:hypothetical protein n=1 Tax=Paraliomyxa miuraensis TaxID=376150 RepID=UPI002257C94F|nr:hypothetical protein [Paraliomyxa miuraensis]MCX4243295.1 hypothetical protein [Paraliomyxa miuraensis]
MQRAHPTAPVLAAVALLAGILQVMATVLLGLAPLEELREAATEGAELYLAGTLATVLGVTVVWFLRRRPLWAALLLLTWQGAVFWPLRARTSLLGLAFHGEYVLHHFTGVLAASVCVAIGVSWMRRRELGPLRMLPGGLAVTGTLGLLSAHVLEQPSLVAWGGGNAPAWLERGGAALLLLSWGAALATLWKHLGPPRLRAVALALWLPFVARVALSWPEGLAGASVADGGRPVLMLCMVAAAMATFTGFRPKVSPGVRTLVLTFSGLATVLLYYFYRRGFGELEAGLGGLAQSMFAFSLPYPNYVPAWQVWGVMLGLFAMFAAAYAGLVSPGNRIRGVALALLVVTGLGLSTPPLVLMTGAAALLWIDSISSSGPAAETRLPPPRAMEEILEGTAERLSLPGMVMLEGREGALLAVRGELDDTAIDLRARPSASAAPNQDWTLTLTVGLLGRERPVLVLFPERGDDGPRPAHLLGRTHRARGQIRRLELLDDALLDTLLAFPHARVEFWDAGARATLHGDLSQLDDERLAALVRALAQIEW